jgi:hypothetical protein
MINSRRDFLKTFVAASATVPLISSINASAYEGKKLGVALIGLGSYATNRPIS